VDQAVRVAARGGDECRRHAVSWLGNLPNRELAKRVSPLTYVRSGLPSILTIHGDADKLVPYSHAGRLHEALTKAGVRNQLTLVTLPGAGHADFTNEQELKAFETVRAFLVGVGHRWGTMSRCGVPYHAEASPPQRVARSRRRVPCDSTSPSTASTS
jgi:acetyl esterase/lipase